MLTLWVFTEAPPRRLIYQLNTPYTNTLFKGRKFDNLRYALRAPRNI